MVAQVVNEIFLLCGACAAEQYARELGKAELAAKLRFGQFRPNRGKFGPERARARAQALAYLARKGEKVAA